MHWLIFSFSEHVIAFFFQKLTIARAYSIAVWAVKNLIVLSFNGFVCELHMNVTWTWWTNQKYCLWTRMHTNDWWPYKIKIDVFWNNEQNVHCYNVQKWPFNTALHISERFFFVSELTIFEWMQIQQHTFFVSTAKILVVHFCSFICDVHLLSKIFFFSSFGAATRIGESFILWFIQTPIRSRTKHE